MKKIDALTESFKARFEKFIIGCDSLEEIEMWDKEANGELDAYCMNELICTILRLIVADGTISEHEVDYLNENFGFSYELVTLRDVYENCQNEISDSFDERIREDIEMLESINVRLAEAFKELVELICEIIAGSDGSVSDEEQKEIQSIKAVL